MSLIKQITSIEDNKRRDFAMLVVFKQILKALIFYLLILILVGRLQAGKVGSLQTENEKSRVRRMINKF